MSRLLLCTDLDRTLLPNGPQPESPQARPMFAALVAKPQVQLAYVTGRHRALVEEAIAEYKLPRPDFVVGDVGTSIYSTDESGWVLWSSWHDVLASNWGKQSGQSLSALFEDLHELTPQEPEKQGRFKSSYYAPPTIDTDRLRKRMMERLKDAGLPSRIIWSIDDNRHIGLVDVLPENASKLHALRFVMDMTDHTVKNTLFAGDSGNDLAVLVSEIPSVLVANATDTVRKEAFRLVRQAGTGKAFYAAQGGFRTTNGNYSAGILEGLVHFLPETDSWIP